MGRHQRGTHRLAGTGLITRKESLFLHFQQKVSANCSGALDRVYHEGIDDKVKVHDFANILTVWKEKQFIGTSPTTNVGVDFNVEHFDKAHIYIGRKSCVVRDMFQLLHRVRHLKDNENSALFS